uniref:Uncharacterized protein n=1 Tax=Rhizophora mucronata TaxID=61149 RepID=A0A2P2KCL6_RHIMU
MTISHLLLSLQIHAIVVLFLCHGVHLQLVV